MIGAVAALLIPLDLSDIHEKLDQILANQAALLAIQTVALGSIMADLTAITAEVTETGDAVDSAVLLLDRLADLVEQAGTDEVALQAIVADLRSSKEDLAAAVVRNTPADPEPTPEPVPEP